MTTLRMPQPGEKWRYRPREGEGPVCPHCGLQYPKISTSDPDIVTIIGPCEYKTTMCGACSRMMPIGPGYYISFDLGNLGLPMTIPYTWLEPLDWRPS